MTVRQITLRQGEVREVLATLPEKSVQLVVTSPPYFHQRDYELEPSRWADGWVGCFGLEPSVRSYVDHSVEVLRAVRRVLRDDGLVYWNIGDSYAGSGKGPSKSIERKASCLDDKFSPPDVKRKSLCLVPERVATALEDDGWYVRSKITWCKQVPKPESVKDRPTSATELILMLSKRERYYYDAEAVREPAPSAAQTAHNQKYAKRYDKTARKAESHQPGNTNSPDIHSRPGPGGHNLRNYWVLPPEPCRDEHYAAFPTEIPRRAILAGSRPGDLVLDPFVGSGTTALAAASLGRRCVGIDQNGDFLSAARLRFARHGFADVTDLDPALLPVLAKLLEEVGA